MECGLEKATGIENYWKVLEKVEIMSNGQSITTGIHTLPMCGCGCTVGDCYHIGCHCQYFEESLSTNKHKSTNTTNNQLTKSTKKTENNKTKED